ncbi:MAG TPA: hypothetical protein PK263_04460, partial [bacterium]|nr:hypothetical protein [bacterium]
AELERELGTEVVERYEHRLQKAFNHACQEWGAFVMKYSDLIAQKFSEFGRFSDDSKWIDISEVQGKHSRITVMLSERAFKERDPQGDGVLLVCYKRFWGAYKKLGGFYTRQGHSNGSPIVDMYDERYIEEFLHVNASTIATHVFGRQKAVELTGGTGFEPESAPAPGGTGTEPIAAMAPEGGMLDLVAEPTRMPDATDDFAREQGEENTTAESTLGAHQETEEELKQRRLNALRNQLQQGGKEQ